MPNFSEILKNANNFRREIPFRNNAATRAGQLVWTYNIESYDPDKIRTIELGENDRFALHKFCSPNSRTHLLRVNFSTEKTVELIYSRGFHKGASLDFLFKTSIDNSYRNKRDFKMLLGNPLPLQFDTVGRQIQQSSKFSEFLVDIAGPFAQAELGMVSKLEILMSINTPETPDDDNDNKKGKSVPAHPFNSSNWALES